MSNNIQNIIRGSLGKTEAAFITQIGKGRFFSIDDARKILRHEKNDPTSQFLGRLRRKGWILRIKRGLYAIVPLSAGEEANPQIHEFLVAMQLVQPAAIAYWTALNHHGMTEQLPRTVYIATNHLVRHPSRDVLWLNYKIVSLRAPRYFGIMEDWIDEGQFNVTDREKTIIDGLDLPEYVGGVGEIVKALRSSWQVLDTEKLFRYAVRIGNLAVVKRLGFLMEALKLGDAEPLRKRVPLSKGFSPLDPLMPHRGSHSRRWGLLVNVGDFG